MIIVRHIFLFLIIFILSLLLVVWAASPLVIRPALTDFLSEYEVQVSPESNIRLNPFTLSVQVNDLAIFTEGPTKQEQKPVLSLENATINLELLTLVSKTLSLSEFSLSGLYLEVDNRFIENQNELTVAGINLSKLQPQTEDPNAELETEKQAIQGAESAPSSFQVDIDLLHLQKIQIQYSHNDVKTDLGFNEISITDLFISETQNRLNLKIDASVNEAPLSIETKINLGSLAVSEPQLFEGDLEIDIELTELNLAHLTHFIPASTAESTSEPVNIENIDIEGELSFSAKAKLDLGQQEHLVQMVISDADILLDKNEIGLENYQYMAESQGVHIEETHVNITPDGNLKLDIESFKLDLDTIDLGITSIETGEFTEKILGKLGFVANNIRVETNEEESGQGNISALIEDALVELTNITTNIDTFSYSTDQKAIAFDNIQFTQKSNSDPSIYLGNLTLVSPTTFSITDRSVTPVFQTNLTLNKFETGPYDMSEQNNESPFNLVGGDDEYARFALNGWIKPFEETLSMKLAADVQEFPLPQISPYIASALGLELKTGQFNTLIDIDVLNDQIEGTANLDLRGLKLDKAGGSNALSLADGKSISLNVALGVLMDDQGNLELRVPVSGDVNSPGFGVNNLAAILIKKAAILKAKDYVINTFLPYASVIKIATVAGSYALQIRVEPLIFSAEQEQLDEQQNAFLAELSTLMKNSNNSQLKVCPLASLSDINSATLVSFEELQDVQIEELHQLSNTRANLVKGYLVNTGEIVSARILLCNPSIQTSIGASPKIEFTLD